MPHVDEGTLHALLDGELGAAEVLEVQTHFATCPACAARLDEARQLLAETERLVTALEPPADGAARGPRLVVGRPMIPLDPVVLIPDNPTPTEVRRSRFKIMAWAAAFLVVVGAGFFGLEMSNGLPGSHKVGKFRIRPEEFTSGPTKDSAATPNQPPPAARPDEAPQRASPFATATPQSPPAAGAAPAPAGKAPPAAGGTPAPAEKTGSQGATEKAAPAAAANKDGAQNKPTPAQKAPPPAEKPAPAPAPPSRDLAQQSQPSAQKAEEAKAQPKPTQPKAADAEPAESSDGAGEGATEDRATIAARGAKATEDLDRERMRQRAAEATAELDRQREQERAAAAEAQRRDSIQAANAAAAQRAVPTTDQQARLSSRIGLDEAAHQLGGPLHAIDGMTRQLIGLVSPQLVPGSDTTRPVVRAVYVDRTGRTIYLDQQRVRPGQLDLPFTPQTGANGQQMWVSGSVLLVLQGDLGPDSLRSLARRVR
jgi:hypothetical protein